MLAIVTTHPIQYQVPLWQKIKKETDIDFEVWYLSDHGINETFDKQFSKKFSWDINTLEGYNYRFIKVGRNKKVNEFWGLRIVENISHLFTKNNVDAVWINGWGVFAYWQIAWTAKKVGVKVILRGESNDLTPKKYPKEFIKHFLLRRLFNKVDYFLFIGSANKRLYKKYGIAENQLFPSYYCVDNERFREQAEQYRDKRTEIRKKWNIPVNTFCVLFAGKFIHKKRPYDIVDAVQSLIDKNPAINIHILFVGSGELDEELRRRCNVVFDVCDTLKKEQKNDEDLPNASFAGFLNQTQISRAYVAADCLILPSDYNETWGLVVNEAIASGLPCIVSDACGCTEDLILQDNPRFVFKSGDIRGLEKSIIFLSKGKKTYSIPGNFLNEFSFETTIKSMLKITQSVKA